jgi:ketosteroid isomerase-like protein/uncharacterized protein YndB with AHSA1/START domain
MTTQDFTTTVLVDQSPKEVFNAVTNVRGWWSEGIKGGTAKLNDEFTYSYHDVHRCKMRLVEVVEDKKVVWLVLDNYFNFTNDKTEWIGTKAIFEIGKRGNQTELKFTHEGLTPEYECYGACVNGWTQYIERSLVSLITTGKGLPNSDTASYTVHEVALRFSELAKEEKWFEIQDEFFENDVKSIEPADSPWFKSAEGKAAVRQKGEDFIKRITEVHRTYTTEPVVGGNYFAVGREVDITVQELGRIQHKQVMLYEVKNGKIISEQFFY